MAEINVRIAQLIVKKLESAADESEEKELQEWIEQSPVNRRIAEEFLDEQNLRKGVAAHWIEDRIWQRIQATVDQPAVIPIRKNNFIRYFTAACIILLLCLASYFIFFHKLASTSGAAPVELLADIEAPAANRATIILSNGKKIYLDSMSNGTLTSEGNVRVNKLGDGSIKYNPALTRSDPNLSVLYNTLVNPRGSRVIDITLSDGSRIWLNSESSIKYPIVFTGSERIVEITGEAYFEVSHIKQSGAPAKGDKGNADEKYSSFIVKKGTAAVEVLGTHFNVNAYEDDRSIKVTLLEGSVKVSDSRTQNSKTIKPGEQAAVAGNGQVDTHSAVDLDEVMAWKDGRFIFSGSSIEAIMNQISRWYDVDLIYKGQIREKFGGTISRNVNVSRVLNLLELTGEVKFKVEDRKITVIPR